MPTKQKCCPRTDRINTTGYLNPFLLRAVCIGTMDHLCVTPLLLHRYMDLIGLLKDAYTAVVLFRLKYVIMLL